MENGGSFDRRAAGKRRSLWFRASASRCRPKDITAILSRRHRVDVIVVAAKAIGTLTDTTKRTTDNESYVHDEEGVVVATRNKQAGRCAPLFLCASDFDQTDVEGCAWINAIVPRCRRNPIL